MNKSMLLGAALVLASPVFSQGYMTTPPDGLSAEGAQSCNSFGWFAEGRFQLADGMHRGKAVTIASISFRADHRNHNAYTGMGRTWTNISLHVSETSNFDRMSQTWTVNITSEPTEVFDSSWRWETLEGFPVTKPDVWGGIKGHLSFPFKKPWVYTGKNDILMDYIFLGGTLENNGTWNSSRSVGFSLDSRYIEWNRFRSEVEQVPTYRNRCADSALNQSSSAFIEVWAYAYGASSSTRSKRGSVSLDGYSYYTGSNSPVLHVFGLGGFSEGIDVGARCNKLYVDFAKPAAVLPLQAGANGYTRVPSLQAPWEPEFSALELHVQAAWADTKTEELSLTNGVQLTLPKELPAPFIPRYKTCDSADPKAPGAKYPPVTSGHRFPYTRYEIR